MTDGSLRHERRVETVACLGSSTTASRGTYKWIDELQERPHNERFRFVNLGVGGDLSFNTVRRLDKVIDIRPGRVIVLIGTNDILASSANRAGDGSSESKPGRTFWVDNG
jgi:lysophospholipase L1-like esterase